MNEFLVDKFFIDLFSNIISDNLTLFAKIITFFGSTFWFIILCIVLFFIFRNKRKNIIIVTNLLSIVVIVNVLKLLIQRTRPSYNSLVTASGYSFPSGHSCVSMAFYGFLIYLIMKSNINKTWKIVSVTLISLLIVLIGLSRVYLGVHYVTDVIVGFILGIVYLIIFTKTVKNKL